MEETSWLSSILSNPFFRGLVIGLIIFKIKMINACRKQMVKLL